MTDYKSRLYSMLAPVWIRRVAVFLGLYLAAPLFEIPVVGISFSAPAILWLAFKGLTGWGGVRPIKQSPLILFLGLAWLGLFSSLLINALTGTIVTGLIGSLGEMLRLAFLIVSALVAYRLFLSRDLGEDISRAFACGIVVVAGFVLLENALFGGLQESGWSSITRMSQNSYAIQFSTFLPFLYAASVSGARRDKYVWGSLLVIALLAIVLNSSRSAWITTGITLLVFFFLDSVSRRRPHRALVLVFTVVCGVAMSWSLATDEIRQRVSYELDTFENLERDKSWAIRQIQVEKGLLLFADSPIIGVGPGQFRNMRADITLPEVFSHKIGDPFLDVSAHNSYVQFLAEGGFVFAAPFAALLVWLAVRGVSAAIYLSRHEGAWPIALYSGFIGMSIHLWTLSGLTSTGPWFIYGAVAASIWRARTTRKLSMSPGRDRNS